MALGFQEQEEEEKKDCFTTSSDKRIKRIKFHVNDRVEVFSEEEGLQGSWHPGTVISTDSNDWQLTYHVKYDHLLDDDGSGKLVGCLNVSELVSDNDCATGNLCNNRVRIRPIQPRAQSGVWNLCYGMCVDVYYDDGWWEGVVFDHNNGSENRSILFPELGDEMMVHINEIRITRDWNDVTGTWRIRGTWLFLELIEEYEKEHYIPVSMRQLWYDLREKDDFKKLGEWTSNQKDLWKSLVLEAIDDNLKIFLDHLLQKIGVPENAEEQVETATSVYDVNKYTESDPNSPNNPSIQERSTVHQLEFLSHDQSNANPLSESDLSFPEKAGREMPQVFPVLPSNHDGTSVTTSATSENISSSDANNGKYSSSVCRKANWLPVGPDIVPGPEFCPDAVIKYAQKRQESLIVDCKKHLLHLNWKIEYYKDRFNRFRYTSPDGKQYYSLVEVCLALAGHHKGIISPVNQNEVRSSSCPGNSISRLIKQPPDNHDPMVSSHFDIHAVEPEYCPEAATDWYKFGFEERLRSKKKRENVRQMILKAKKHLSALGWSFRYIYRKGRRELRYISPWGRFYNSLRQACRDSRNRTTSGGNFSTSTYPERKSVGKIVEGRLDSSKLDFLKLENCSVQYPFRKPSVLQKLKVGQITKMKKKSKKMLEGWLLRQDAISVSRNFLSKMRNRGKNRGLIKLKNSKKGSWPNHVLRSSKRVQQVVVPNPSDQKPLTVFSWLIENTDVLPRAKISYCRSKGDHPIAEGRIRGGGIKCNCCGKVYTLRGFEYHVNGKHGRSAASILSNIFLKDGRSLLDCEMQIILDDTRNSRTEPLERLQGIENQGENDHICSICHYGGELILCDQCPSSFHKSCLGMVDVPDGDWFCSSCCCKICGQNKLKRDSDHPINDDRVLDCTQCERKYHVRCLRKGEECLEYFSKENWCCSKKCQEIFSGLHELLGKPIPVGLNNLSWTLLKSTQFNDHKREASGIEALSENYIMLNIALEMMHECFEPVEEQRTKRDLLRDVIFSRRSELNRLNFRGFYTILLQKDDEFVAVATIRVYGDKVAEIPLVGTRFQYRRLGMCRILMNTLEKKLSELGVQRIILPAVPSVLNTWTGSFGFSEVTDSERLSFLDYTFLDFQGTTMCHKLLMKIPSAESSPSREVQPRLENDASENGDNVEGSSPVSEVFQADKVGSEIEEHGKLDS